MRKLILILLLLISLCGYSQTITQWYGGPNTLNSFRGFVQVDSVLSIPKDTIALSPARKLFPLIAAKGDSLYRWSTAQDKYVFIGSGSAVTWGSITGTLSTQTDLQTALDAKQNEITLGTTAQYFRGDLSLSTFSSDVTAIGDLNYANITHTHSGLLPIGGTTGQIIKKNSSSDYDYSWQDEGTGYVLSTRQINTGLWLSGGGDLSTDRTLIADSAAMAGYFLRRKDSSVNGGYYPYATNPKNYLVAADIAGKLNYSDTAAMKLQRDSDTTLWDATKTDITNAIAGVTGSYIKTAGKSNLTNDISIIGGDGDHSIVIDSIEAIDIRNRWSGGDITNTFSIGFTDYRLLSQFAPENRSSYLQMNSGSYGSEAFIKLRAEQTAGENGEFDVSQSFISSIADSIILDGILKLPSITNATASNVLYYDAATKKVTYGVAASGGSPNSNIGAGFRLAVPNTNNIKTLFNGYSVLIDSSSNTNGLTFKVDTANISTKAYAQSLVDAVSGGGGGSYADADVEDYLETYTGDVTFTGTVSSITSGSIVNTDINASAAIAYSKLNLTGAILNADLAGSIALSKLSITGTPDGTKFLRDDGSWQTVSGSSQWANETGGISYTDKVLIGSTGVASSNLHIKTATTAGAWVQSGEDADEYAQMVFGNATTLAGGKYAQFIRFSNATATNGGDFIIENDTKRILLTTSTSSGYREDLYITSSGNVGVGGEIGVVGLATFNNRVAIAEITAPSTPASGFGALYPKTDGKLYWKDDAGTEYDLTSAGGASTFASLTDVNITSIATNDFLKWDGTDWINRTPTNVRTDLGLVIGTNVQAYDADLTTYAGITPSANVQTLLGSADFAAFKTLLTINNVDNTSDATKWAATATLTNKRITVRVGSTASSATPTPDADAHDQYEVTALAANAVFAAPTGTPTDGQKLVIRIKDNGTSRTLGWNAIYRAGSDIALPTATTINKALYVGFVFNTASSTWDCVSSLNGF